jgi:hypothetical protein
LERNRKNNALEKPKCSRRRLRGYSYFNVNAATSPANRSFFFIVHVQGSLSMTEKPSWLVRVVAASCNGADVLQAR